MRRYIILAILFNTLFISAQNSKRIPPEKPKLVVGIIISQMRYDYLTRYWNKFSPDGFKKLIAEGSFCRDTKYGYLFSNPATGHATVATGAMPSVHGIVAEEWFDRLKNKTQHCIINEKYSATGGSYESGKFAPTHLITGTLGDEMRLAYQSSKVISISLDPASAIFSGGHTPNQVYWYDPETGTWMSSTYYMKDLPQWVEEFNRKMFPDVYLAESWNTLLPIDQYTESWQDRNKYEKGIKGLTTFPYDVNQMSIKGKQRDYSLLPSIPAGNVFTRDFAVNAIVNENLGKDDTTDLLLLSFSVTGNIGNLYGPQAIETEDVFLRLDQELGHFIRFIEEEIGRENVLFYLTADHGVSSVPQYLEDQGIPSGVFNQNQALALLSSYLNVLYGKGEWIKLYKNQQLYLNQTLIEDSKIPLDQFQTTVANFLVQFSGVTNAITGTVMQNTSFSAGILQKMQNIYNQKRSGDIFINLEPGWIEKNGHATGHSSSWSYDSHVPLIWYGWKIPRQTIYTPLDPTSIAPTIASFLELLSPNGSTASPIMELVVR